MPALDRLRNEIAVQEERACRDLPGSRVDRLVTLAQVLGNRLPNRLSPLQPDLVTGHRLVAAGANKALHRCLVTGKTGDTTGITPERSLAAWIDVFLGTCDALALAGVVCDHVEEGFMRLVETGPGTFDAWFATRSTPPGWIERADVNWWARSLIRTDGSSGPAQRIQNSLAAMAWQPPLPSDAVIDGVSIRVCRDVIASLLGRAVEVPAHPLAPTPKPHLATLLATETGHPRERIEAALSALTLTEDNAAWHAAVPGIAAAPVIRIDDDNVLVSPFGVVSEPLHFLARELRRRAPDAYRNAAAGREAQFRDDLSALFAGTRFAASANPVKLRSLDGKLRTDIDAAIFDRKSGTLAVFELKSHDPFPRTVAEAIRQRDNILGANRQVSNVLDWLNRHGPDEILNRIDAAVARRFRVQKVLPFVLGRYVIHGHGGSQPNRRAAWGTWPQVLRLIESVPIRPADANPLGTLYNRLLADAPSVEIPPALTHQELRAGDLTLQVYASAAAYRDAQGS